MIARRRRRRRRRTAVVAALLLRMAGKIKDATCARDGEDGGNWRKRRRRRRWRRLWMRLWMIDFWLGLRMALMIGIWWIIGFVE
ncbi:Uncharacterized protein APZ42_026475 [Daphnia magna]|uniref:Uncharacterized protein n=1 Tax=Daphnia magna TaxID=35525 RepID=A0A164S7S7_9CRUS|nr:Uncharacterized protein APZ42_026475 [Daphnia magna]